MLPPSILTSLTGFIGAALGAYFAFYIRGAVTLREQIAVYSQDLHYSVMAWDGPPLFMNPFMLLFVTGLALLGFAIELIVGARAKAWWEAALLPIPPIVLASYFFRRTNPVPPFFVGLVALLVALILKIM